MKYNLVGVNGNAYTIMGYVIRAMRKEGYSDKDVEQYRTDAMSSDYNHLLSVSVKMIGEINYRIKTKIHKVV